MEVRRGGVGRLSTDGITHHCTMAYPLYSDSVKTADGCLHVPMARSRVDASPSSAHQVVDTAAHGGELGIVVLVDPVARVLAELH